MRINSYWPETYLDGGEQKNPTTQRYTNATQNCLRSQMSRNATRAYGKESFAVHRADTSCGKLRQRPCQQYGYQKGVRQSRKLIHAFRNSRGTIPSTP